MKKSILLAAVMLISASGFAATIVLNPGDTNTFGQQLTCTLGGGDLPPPNVPTPPPVVINVYHRTLTSSPDMNCIKNLPKTDARSMVDNFMDACQRPADTSMCDQGATTIGSREIPGCYDSIAAKCTSVPNSSDGQPQAIHALCTVTQIDCAYSQ